MYSKSIAIFVSVSVWHFSRRYQPFYFYWKWLNNMAATCAAGVRTRYVNIYKVDKLVQDGAGVSVIY